MTLLDAFLLSIATWRLSRLFVTEDGPYAIFKRLRGWKPLTELLSCIYCVSIWAAAILLVIHLFVTPYPVWILAISGTAMMLRAYSGVIHA